MTLSMLVGSLFILTFYFAKQYRKGNESDGYGQTWMTKDQVLKKFLRYGLRKIQKVSHISELQILNN